MLLVGVNKIDEILKIEKNRLTDLALLKVLKQTSYPIQAVKLVEYPGNRVGHNAYVLLRNAVDVNQLQPLKDVESGVILQWTTLENYDRICGKCLSWTGHAQTCPKHETNKHRFVAARETSGEWDVGEAIRNSFKRKRK